MTRRDPELAAIFERAEGARGMVGFYFAKCSCGHERVAHDKSRETGGLKCGLKGCLCSVFDLAADREADRYCATRGAEEDG